MSLRDPLRTSLGLWAFRVSGSEKDEEIPPKQRQSRSGDDRTSNTHRDLIASDKEDSCGHEYRKQGLAGVGTKLSRE